MDAMKFAKLRMDSDARANLHFASPFVETKSLEESKNVMTVTFETTMDVMIDASLKQAIIAIPLIQIK